MERSLCEHDDTRRLLVELRVLQPGGHAELFARGLRVLRDRLMHHIEEQEDALFVRLRAGLSVAERHGLGLAAKRIVSDTGAGEPIGPAPRADEPR
jgi:hypothetical protein